MTPTLAPLHTCKIVQKALNIEGVHLFGHPTRYSVDMVFRALTAYRVITLSFSRAKHRELCAEQIMCSHRRYLILLVAGSR